MLNPGPDHPIRLEPAAQRWRAFFNGHVIADTDDALILEEADLPPVVYFPRRDVSMEYMGRTDRQTHCPYKGDAAYYTLTMDGQVAENVAWSYEQPFDAMGQIGERIAFYTDRVEVYPVDDATVNPHHRREEARSFDRREVDEVVQHTDSGAGASQREPWAPNVEGPEGGLR
jgi:uncharacterized protein (DUF427 family)